MKCDYCTRRTQGLYDFGCDRCLARHYVREPWREQVYTLRLWKESFDLQRFEEMQRLIAEEQARLKK